MNRRVGVLLLAMLLGLATSARAVTMHYHLEIKNETNITQRIAFEHMQCMHIVSHSGGYEIAAHQVWNGTMITTIVGYNFQGIPCISHEVASAFWLVVDHGLGGALKAEKRTLRPWELVKRRGGRYHIDAQPGLWLHVVIR